MTVVSDTIDENGKRHLVVRYTEEEKAAMEARRAELQKKHEEVLKKLEEIKKRQQAKT